MAQQILELKKGGLNGLWTRETPDGKEFEMRRTNQALCHQTKRVKGMLRTTRSDNSFQVVIGTGADETAVLDGFVITAGYANGPGASDGGGMFNAGDNGTVGNPVMINCMFERRHPEINWHGDSGKW